jgi:hypothetical protein
LASGEGAELIRSPYEQLRYEFCESYKRWRKLSNENAWAYEVDSAWIEYCESRDKWLNLPPLGNYRPRHNKNGVSYV